MRRREVVHELYLHEQTFVVVAVYRDWIDRQTSFGDTDFLYISRSELLHNLKD